VLGWRLRVPPRFDFGKIGQAQSHGLALRAYQSAGGRFFPTMICPRGTSFLSRGPVWL
jgi:hypothetical protein